MNVVLDTNIFVSGIFWKGESNKTLLAWRDGKFNLVTSLDIILEIIRILKDFKIQLPGGLIKEWTDLIVTNSIIVKPKEKINIVKNDPQDNMFIEAAVAGMAEYIVSQDNHLLQLKSFQNIKIVAPAKFNSIAQ